MGIDKLRATVTKVGDNSTVAYAQHLKSLAANNPTEQLGRQVRYEGD